MNDFVKSLPFIFIILAIGWVIQNVAFFLIMFALIFALALIKVVFDIFINSSANPSVSCRSHSIGRRESSLDELKKELKARTLISDANASKIVQGESLNASVSDIVRDINNNGALIIDKPWIELILSGKKSWEMRTTKFKKLGYIGLVEKGSKTITGIAYIDGYTPPLSIDELKVNKAKHQIPESLFMANDYKWFVAMKLSNVVRLSTPVPYSHKNGTVIWVRLSEQSNVLMQLREALSKTTVRPPSKRIAAKRRVESSDKIYNVTESKIWLRDLMKSHKVSSKQQGKWPVCARGKMLSAEKSQKDGLYHLKRGNLQYRFESLRDTLGALRRDEQLEWAIFTNTYKRTWKKTASWEVMKSREIAR